MIEKEEYLKAKEVVAEYEKQLNIHLVSKCCDGHIEERDRYIEIETGRLFCKECDKTLNPEILEIKGEKFELNEGVGDTLKSDTVATITTNHPQLGDDVPKEWRR